VREEEEEEQGGRRRKNRTPLIYKYLQQTHGLTFCMKTIDRNGCSDEQKHIYQEIIVKGTQMPHEIIS